MFCSSTGKFFLRSTLFLYFFVKSSLVEILKLLFEQFVG